MGLLDKFKKKEKFSTEVRGNTSVNDNGIPVWVQENVTPIDIPVQQNVPYLNDKMDEESNKQAWESDVRMSDNEFYFVFKKIVPNENKEYLIDVIEDHIPSPEEIIHNYVRIYGGSKIDNQHKSLYKIYVGEDPKSTNKRFAYSFQINNIANFLSHAAAEKIEKDKFKEYRKLKKERELELSQLNPQINNQIQNMNIPTIGMGMGMGNDTLSLILSGYIDGISPTTSTEVLAYKLVADLNKLKTDLKSMEEENYNLKMENMKLSIQVEQAKGNDIGKLVGELNQMREWHSQIDSLLGNKEPSTIEIVKGLMDGPLGQSLIKETVSTLSTAKDAFSNRNNVVNQMPVQTQMQPQMQPQSVPVVQPQVEYNEDMSYNVENNPPIQNINELMVIDVTPEKIAKEIYNELGEAYDVILITTKEVYKRIEQPDTTPVTVVINQTKNAINNLKEIVSALHAFKQYVDEGGMDTQMVADLLVNNFYDKAKILGSTNYDELVNYANMYKDTATLKNMIMYLKQPTVKEKLTELINKVRERLHLRTQVEQNISSTDINTSTNTEVGFTMKSDEVDIYENYEKEESNMEQFGNI